MKRQRAPKSMPNIFEMFSFYFESQIHSTSNKLNKCEKNNKEENKLSSCSSVLPPPLVSLYVSFRAIYQHFRYIAISLSFTAKFPNTSVALLFPLNLLHNPIYIWP
ncbi:unnamed protein product [Ceratitis capitata]|uniref:(Mediterranean fruit fly) hypothetical protein n=1 Tax=Ceratitis capitata TaxID=7213 RepID=A0A811TX58_CERCA|nr:unnamed protein product [Ceratitis capitata]